jgi:hypothetical protein
LVRNNLTPLSSASRVFLVTGKTHAVRGFPDQADSQLSGSSVSVQLASAALTQELI